LSKLTSKDILDHMDFIPLIPEEDLCHLKNSNDEATLIKRSIECLLKAAQYEEHLGDVYISLQNPKKVKVSEEIPHITNLIQDSFHFLDVTQLHIN